MNRVAILLASGLMLAGISLAQESKPREPQEKIRSFTITKEGPNVGFAFGGNMMLQDDRIPVQDISFFSAEVAAAGEVVTGAPYTATAVTENTQLLSDGNRIVNKSSAFVARDGQGRTRREVSFDRLGTMQMDSPKVVFINDPTTHAQYVITPDQSTKVVKSGATWSSGPTIIDLHSKMEGLHKRVIEEKIAAGTTVQLRAEERPEQKREVKHEDLGTQTVEGVSAEGKRETVTIPAGQIGNERPIEIVSETWFSPELRTMVMRKHSDPRVGETVFRLTDIKRGEPDAALFQAPAGAKTRIEPLVELHHEGTPPKE
jgi:hypothetical protein